MDIGHNWYRKIFPHIPVFLNIHQRIIKHLHVCVPSKVVRILRVEANGFWVVSKCVNYVYKPEQEIYAPYSQLAIDRDRRVRIRQGLWKEIFDLFCLKGKPSHQSNSSQIVRPGNPCSVWVRHTGLSAAYNLNPHCVTAFMWVVFFDMEVSSICQRRSFWSSVKVNEMRGICRSLTGQLFNSETKTTLIV